MHPASSHGCRTCNKQRHPHHTIALGVTPKQRHEGWGLMHSRRGAFFVHPMQLHRACCSCTVLHCAWSLGCMADWRAAVTEHSTVESCCVTPLQCGCLKSCRRARCSCILLGHGVGWLIAKLPQSLFPLHPVGSQHCVAVCKRFCRARCSCVSLGHGNAWLTEELVQNLVHILLLCVRACSYMGSRRGNDEHIESSFFILWVVVHGRP